MDDARSMVDVPAVMASSIRGLLPVGQAGLACEALTARTVPPTLSPALPPSPPVPREGSV
jgi:hypothetical protein